MAQYPHGSNVRYDEPLLQPQQPPQQHQPPPQYSGYGQAPPPQVYGQGLPPQQQQAYPPQGHGFQGEAPYQPSGSAGGFYGGFDYGQADRFGQKFNYYEAPPQPTAAAAAPAPQGSRYRDLLWAILFIIHLALVFVIMGAGLSREAPKVDCSPKPAVNGTTPAPDARCTADGVQKLNTFSFDGKMGEIFIVAACAACAGGVLLSFLYLMLIQRFARAMIWATLIINILIWVAYSVALFALGQIVAAFIFGVCAIIMVLFAMCWRKRIPFAATMLKTISTTLQAYPSPIYLAWGSIPVQVGWLVAWVATVAGAQRIPFLAGALGAVFLLLSFYWVAQVIKNVVHVTASGTFASWYFYAKTDPRTGAVSGMPPNPTLQAFKRSMTTSFGSIALGSLIVAILQTMKAIANALRRNNADNTALRILACFCECILGIVERLLKYFNLYAFTLVAIYGQSYWQAAKDTFSLIRSHGIEAIINDDLITPVLTMGAFAGGLACGAISAGAAAIMGVEGSQMLFIMALLGFLIGFVMMIISMSVVESGVATIFVCFALDPEALRRNNEHLHHKFTHQYDLY